MSRAEPASVNTDPQGAPVGIPFAGIGLSAVAMLFLGAGVFGLLEPASVPQLASPAVAWSLIAVGIVLDVAAILIVLGARKTRAPRRR